MDQEKQQPAFGLDSSVGGSGGPESSRIPVAVQEAWDEALERARRDIAAHGQATILKTISLLGAALAVLFGFGAKLAYDNLSSSFDHKVDAIAEEARRHVQDELRSELDSLDGRMRQRGDADAKRIEDTRDALARIEADLAGALQEVRSFSQARADSLAANQELKSQVSDLRTELARVQGEVAVGRDALEDGIALAQGQLVRLREDYEGLRSLLAQGLTEELARALVERCERIYSAPDATLEERQTALRQVAALGQSGQSAVPGLCNLAERNSTPVALRRAALSAIGEVDSGQADTVRRVCAMAASGGDDVACSATLCLGVLRMRLPDKVNASDVMLSLLEVTKSKDPRNVEAAVTVMGMFPTEGRKHIPYLLELVRDGRNDDRLRRAAVQSLGSLNVTRKEADSVLKELDSAWAARLLGVLSKDG
jgi:hypothetical protein